MIKPFFNLSDMGKPINFEITNHTSKPKIKKSHTTKSLTQIIRTIYSNTLN